MIFFVLIAVMSLLYGYHKSSQYGPYSMHHWRQSDCLSIALNYYEKHSGFFQPEINWTNIDGKQKVVSEFPAIYYTVAQLWKMFGKEEIIFRLLNLSIMIFGFFHLFLLGKRLLVNEFWAGFVVLFLFTSPLLAFYANNFLSNAPAFGLVLIAWYYMYLFYAEKKSIGFIIGTLFFLLAGMLKITALLSFIALIPIHFYVLYKRKMTVSKNIFVGIVPILTLFAVVFLWYGWAKQYNKENIQYLFLQGILPIWDMDNAAIKDVNLQLRKVLLPIFFNKHALYFLLGALLFILIKFKKSNKFLSVLILNIIAGVFLYMLLFYQVFNVHDYYMINLLIIIPLVLLQLLLLIKKIHPGLLTSKWSKGVAIATIIILSYNTAVHTRVLYDSTDPLIKPGFFIRPGTVKNWHYFHTNYNKTIKALETIEPYLRHLGLKRDDLVISIPDETPNTTLYLMNQKGFTDYGQGSLRGAARIEACIGVGAKYLIVNDTMLYQEDYLKPYLKNQIGQYLHVGIFNLQ